MIRLLAVLAGMLLANAAAAQPLDLDAIAKQPGTQIAKRMQNGQEIAAMNVFIAANSLRPVTKAQLEKRIQERMEKAAAGIEKAGVPPAQNKVCQRQREEDLIPLNAGLGKYREEFKQVLAVPRPPAFNPCY